MADEDGDRADHGLLGAPTPADPGGDRADRADRRDQAAELVDQGDEDGDLLDGSPDVGATDLLALAADTVAGPRRARGRPKGSANKRNMDMVAYLAALGHRDPLVTLSLLQTADTKALAKAVGLDSAKGRLAVLQIQRQAASDMLPYFYAKKPQQLELPAGDARPVIMIGEMNVHQGGESGAISLMDLQPVRVEKPNEIKGATVRENDDVSHDPE